MDKGILKDPFTMFIPPEQIWIVVVAFIIAFILSFGIGANDVANSFGTSVGSKVISLRNACILASIFEVLGSVLMGAQVSDTIRKGVISPDDFKSENSTSHTELMMLGQLSSLSGACIWLLIATFLKLPVSGSHSIVGAMVGFGLVAQGPSKINWLKLGLIVSSWFISPLLSGLVSVFTFFIFDRFILKKIDPLEPGLSFLPFIYAITIFINIFSVFLSGPKLLKFDKVPLYANFIVSIGLAIITVLVVKFAFVPYLRKSIARKQSSAEKSKIENDVNLRMESVTQKMLNNRIQNDGFVNVKSNLAVLEENELEIVQQAKKDCVIKDKPEQIEIFSWLQILTAIFGSFAHGGNDVSNAIGPLVGLWILAVTQDIKSDMDIPIWILLYGGCGITIGLWVWGRRVMKTIGNELTTITPSSGVSIELGSAITVLVASNVGIPISSTHCKVGSIVSVGRYRSNENVDWKVFRNIVMAWLITLPVSGGIGALVMYLLRMLI